MCGIAGELFFKGISANLDWTQTACHLMQHRGPDGDGFHLGDTIALGHRRLAIIDLSGGAQPMSYADGRYWITFNGEIYNYRSLRTELSQAGFQFSTDSDTEVILAAYIAWGTNGFARLNGIFAFGIWDSAAHELILVRDHLGVKPLFYHRDVEGLRFSSELKGLLAHPQIASTVNRDALRDYLALGYVLTPKTMIEGICKLPPGSFLYVSGEQIQIRPYWELAACVEQSESHTRTDADAITQFSGNLKSAVSEQMISDVPLGAFLSGGIDLSSIAALAVPNSSSAFKTFSIGFDEVSYSELDYAQQAADYVGTKHYTEIVRAPTFDALAKLIWYYDEPIGDTSIIPTYFVARLARQHVTVVLSGDGGDELLAGYDTYIADRLQRWYARIPRWLHQGIIQPGTSLLPASYNKVSLDFKIKQFVAQAYGSAAQAHFGWRKMFSDEELNALMGGDQAAEYIPFERYARYYADVAHASPLKQALYVDMKTWLLDDILTKVDRATMACGLEARVPFLSPQFVEYAFTLPDRMKLSGMNRKVILKQAMRDKLPDTIVNRKKRGFNAPVSHWLRSEWRDEIQELFSKRQSRLIDLEAPLLQTLWRDHCAGRADHGFKLWTLLSLLLWEQQILN